MKKPLPNRPPPTPDAPERRAEPPEDLRVQRTRKRLTEALVELTLEKGYDAVSTRDLTERAGVGYATFFRHYKGKDELLQSILERVIGELLALLAPLPSDEQSAEAGTLVFHHAEQHADLYRVLLRTREVSGLLPQALKVGSEGIRRSFAAKPGSHIPLELAANHFVRSFINLLEWWLDHGMPYVPERMGEIYRDLILHPTETVALRRRSSKPPKGPP